MYLSRLILNPRSREVRRDLSNCHDLHRSVMRGFPEVPAHGRQVHAEARAQLGVLYRLESLPGVGTVCVLVQSGAEPDWSRLPAGYLLETGGRLLNPDMKRVDGAFAAIVAGDELVFRLRANPTKRLPPTTGADGVRRDGKRVELRSEEALLGWLREKGTGNPRSGRGGGGFRLVEVRARPGVAVPGAGAASAVADTRMSGAGKVRGLALRPAAVRAVAEPLRPDAGAAAAGVRQQLTFGDVLFEGRLVVTDAALFRQTLERGIGSGKAYGFGLLSVARGTR